MPRAKTQSLADLQVKMRQIEAQLALLQAERAAAIKQMAHWVRVLGIKPADLFTADDSTPAVFPKPKGKPGRKPGVKPAPVAVRKVTPAQQYEHKESGKRWLGRGPKPQWLKDLIDSGVSLESLKVAAK